jgi:hypothetical protein
MKRHSSHALKRRGFSGAQVIKYLKSDSTAYETYEVEAVGEFKQLHSMKEMLQFIAAKLR